MAWFDSQFPGESVYKLFEISEEKIPSWVKNSARHGPEEKYLILTLSTG